MIARTKLLVGMAVVGLAGAKPSVGPPNPHGTGREPTTIEREHHLDCAADRRDALDGTVRPATRNDEPWVLLRLVFPWLPGR